MPWRKQKGRPGQGQWYRSSRRMEPRDKRMKAICDRLRSGATYAAIGAEFCISTTRVQEIREYAGIEHRRKETEADSRVRTARRTTLDTE